MLLLVQSHQRCRSQPSLCVRVFSGDGHRFPGAFCPGGPIEKHPRDRAKTQHLPATVSVRIAKLERELGVRLLQRTTRSVSLTKTAMPCYHTPSRYWILSVRHVPRSAMGALPLGTLRATAPASFGRMHMVPALPKFFEPWAQTRCPPNHVAAKFSSRYRALSQSERSSTNGSNRQRTTRSTP